MLGSQRFLRLPAVLAAVLTASCLGLTGCVPDSSVRASTDAQPAANSAQAGDDLARIQAAKKVVIGVKADSPPFGRRLGGQYVGFDIDLAQALAKELGIDQVEFVPVTSADRVSTLMDGKVDMVIATMTITRSREQQIDFADIPYFQDGQALLVKKDSPIQSYLDLTGRKVGCGQGTDNASYMKQVAPDCNLVTYPDYQAMMRAFDAGEVEAVTSDMLILIGLEHQAKDPGAYRIAGSRFTTEPYGIAVRQNQSHWRNAVSTALQSLWQDGGYQSIVTSWFGPGSDYQTTLTYAITPYPH